MAIIVTGATGHIGNNVVRHLLKTEDNVVCVIRKESEALQGLTCKKVLGNCFDSSFMESLVSSNDTVVHMAGLIDVQNIYRKECYDINYLGTKNLYDLCKKKHVQHFVYTSSVDCLYKESLESIIAEPKDIYPDRIDSNYGHSKALATKYLLDELQKDQEMKISIVYPSAVIGPNDYKPSAVGKVVLDCIKNKMEFGIEGGYNFVDVDSISEAIITIVKRKIRGQYILSGVDVTVFELYNELNSYLKNGKHPHKIPLFIVKMMIPFVPYLSKFSLATLLENHNYDSSKAKKDLIYDIPAFSETVKKTVDFFVEYNNKKR